MKNSHKIIQIRRWSVICEITLQKGFLRGPDGRGHF